MKIRVVKNEDIEFLADLWLRTSSIAHSFIPVKYWNENKILMKQKYLPSSEIYVAEEKDNIWGFVALFENHIASIFVDNEQQGKGTGRLLLEYVKQLRPNLTLNVYQKNQRAVEFYKKNDFKILSESIDKLTSEKEFIMKWNKNIE